MSVSDFHVRRVLQMLPRSLFFPSPSPKTEWNLQLLYSFLGIVSLFALSLTSYVVLIGMKSHKAEITYKQLTLSHLVRFKPYPI